MGRLKSTLRARLQEPPPWSQQARWLGGLLAVRRSTVAHFLCFVSGTYSGYGWPMPPLDRRRSDSVRVNRASKRPSSANIAIDSQHQQPVRVALFGATTSNAPDPRRMGVRLTTRREVRAICISEDRTSPQHLTAQPASESEQRSRYDQLSASLRRPPVAASVTR